MKNYILLSFSILSFLFANSQVDYNDFDGEVNTSCVAVVENSEDVLKNKQLLDSLSQYEIVKGEERFLHEKIIIYYTSHAITGDTSLIPEIEKIAKKQLEKYGNSAGHWELAIIYSGRGSFKKSIEALDIYIDKASENQKIDYKQVYKLYRRNTEKLIEDKSS